MRHTQGPWHNVANTEIRARFASQNGDHIATVWANGESESAANARLIAAAPDLLVALDAVASCWEKNLEVDDTTMAIVGAALAKARGA